MYLGVKFQGANNVVTTVYIQDSEKAVTYFLLNSKFFNSTISSKVVIDCVKKPTVSTSDNVLAYSYYCCPDTDGQYEIKCNTPSLSPFINSPNSTLSTTHINTILPTRTTPNSDYSSSNDPNNPSSTPNGSNGAITHSVNISNEIIQRENKDAAVGGSFCIYFAFTSQGANNRIITMFIQDDETNLKRFLAQTTNATINSKMTIDCLNKPTVTKSGSVLAYNYYCCPNTDGQYQIRCNTPSVPLLTGGNHKGGSNNSNTNLPNIFSLFILFFTSITIYALNKVL
uniref:Allorecognition 2 n=1 Tax=Panagrolaimus sp. PS1159 TaxID=55785 RepID=A0AC35GM25_9BILA